MKSIRERVIELLVEACWNGYTKVGMKNKGGRIVPNCVPSKGVPKEKKK